jgi:dTDP-4-amino-4,6-dideoxygalactose transaminase
MGGILVKNNKRIFLSPPHMGGGELKSIHEAFESNYIAPLGPMVDAFEKAFADKVGIPYALALSSGTAAMHLALRHLGIGPGDEVVASTLTFIGSVTSVIFQGATPVFIDSDRATWNMDPDLLAEELEACSKRRKLPKAVVPTDLYGQCADYNRVFDICKRYDVPVIVDAAEAMGAKYQKAEPQGLRTSEDEKVRRSETQNLSGSEALSPSDLWLHAGYGARAAIYSFNGNKIITTSGGGMLASDDKELIDHARKLSQQARENFIYYQHEEIGYNYRMSNIVAAIGLGQLKILDERVEKKHWIFEYYKQSLKDLPGIEFMPEAPYGRSNRWLTVVLITPEEFGVDHEAVRLALEAENIESRPIWKPMHLQPVFQAQEKGKEERASEIRDQGPETRGQRSEGRNPQITQIQDKKRYKARVVGGEVAEDLFSRGLCLPSGTAMTEEDMERVVDVIKRCRK